jgi:galactonate dehydratase
MAIAPLGIPVATDERMHTPYEFRELFELQAADSIQVDITHYNVCGPVGTAAALHLAACTANFKIQEHFNDFADAWVNEAVAGQPEVDAADGYFPLPAGPGLGVTLHEDFFAIHPREQVFFDLFAENW